VIQKVFITQNVSETLKIGMDFSRTLKKGSCILLTGNLGSGKTVFVKGIAKGLGIKKTVSSPSFLLVKEYPEKNFIHIDLYRVKSAYEFFSSGLNEYLNNINISAIEWGEKIKKFIEFNHYLINISILEKNKRKIEINKICF